MKILPVGSSSSGNCTLIYNDNTRILIDCGISAKRVFEKTGHKEFSALFISHEHSDHIVGAGPVGRKTKVPIYIHEAVFKAKETDLNDCEIKYINETSVLQIKSLIVKPFSTKHDAKFALGFIIEEPATNTFLCYLTDTGSISKTMRERTKHCNAFFIECDYDDELLATYDGYDQLLKDRISSNFGHLSTSQALEFLSEFDLTKTKGIVIGHISPRTNSPEKVKEHFMKKFATLENKFHIAPFDAPLELT
jgi:phosphoribosyl 1,2-cyclic phosphodiesterase